MGNKLVVLFLGALSLAACATEPDYYEGEIVHTRPIKKPSLDPNTPSELTGTGEPSDIPAINESKIMGQQSFDGGDRFDGRIAWAEEIEKNDLSYTYLHDVDGWNGVDNVTIIDEQGNTVGSYQTKYDPTRSNISLTK
jgi:hypothetical protein